MAMLVMEIFGGDRVKKGTLKQILLITDGCSNKGEDPAATAALAFQQGITVNVIGILDDETEESAGLDEVEEIALSGGGVSQIVYREALPQTVQMVTKQAMTQTLQGFVNQELKQILGPEQTMEDLDPDKRGEIMEVVEDMGETCDLEVLVLVDTSASMHDKLPMVKVALLVLSITLAVRIGRTRLSIVRCPGTRKDLQEVLDWSPELRSISPLSPNLPCGGLTPTGPAITEAMQALGKRRLLRG